MRGPRRAEFAIGKGGEAFELRTKRVNFGLNASDTNLVHMQSLQFGAGLYDFQLISQCLL